MLPMYVYKMDMDYINGKLTTTNNQMEETKASYSIVLSSGFFRFDSLNHTIMYHATPAKFCEVTACNGELAMGHTLGTI